MVDRTRSRPELLLVCALVLLPLVPRARAEDPARRGTEPFVGIEGADPFDPRHADAARLARLGGLGPVLVRTTVIPWERIEQHAPVLDGKHLRDWDALDAFVARWQVAGFEVVPTVSPSSSWAGVGREEAIVLAGLQEMVDVTKLDEAATPPREGSWNAWELFCRELGERYDADAAGDADGVTRPVRWVQLLERPGDPEVWLGTAEAYLRLAHHARAGLQEASPAARLVHGGVRLHALGHRAAGGWPGDRELRLRAKKRWRGLPPSALGRSARALEFDLRTIALRDLFDAVPVRGSPHLLDEQVDLAHLGRVLAAERVEGVERWLEASPSEKTGEASVPTAKAPDLEERQRRARWASTARRTGHGERAKALAWLDRGRAYDVVRTICRVRMAGAERVFLSGRTGGDDPLDVFVSGSPEDGWTRRPPWFALRQALRLLDGHVRAESRSLGRRAQAVTFHRREGASPPWVQVVLLKPEETWAGDPRSPLPPEKVHLPLADGTYVVEQVAVADVLPGVRRVRVDGGVLGVQLTAAPVYVYPAGGS